MVVCGWDPGPRGGLRALVLGARNPAGDLCHIGHVGTGFSAKDRRILRVQLEAIEQPTPPFTQPLTADAGSSMRWVSAVYVGDMGTASSRATCPIPAVKGLRDMPISTVGRAGRSLVREVVVLRAGPIPDPVHPFGCCRSLGLAV